MDLAKSPLAFTPEGKKFVKKIKKHLIKNIFYRLCTVHIHGYKSNRFIREKGEK